MFDKDGNGSITRDELKAVMHNLGQTSSEQEVDELLKEVDIDGEWLIYSYMETLKF